MNDLNRHAISESAFMDARTLHRWRDFDHRSAMAQRCIEVENRIIAAANALIAAGAP